MKQAISKMPLLLLVGLLCHLAASAQSSNNRLTGVINKLKLFSADHIAEKAYLHFDKPYYAAGDTIYFKAYVTMGERHQPSHLSGVLHVDLINTHNKIDLSIKLQIADGIGWGDFALPDSLPAGNYRVRAYTNWMRNDGNYFYRDLPVGSSHNTKISESSIAHKSANSKPDIQFFPEGGEIVTGIRSKIAFKAVSVNGLGIGVTGTIVDNAGNEIATLKSSHLGMGYFYLTPQQGKTYQAKLTYSDGTQSSMDIPKAANKGVVLSINNDSVPKASVRIEASKAYYDENKGKEYHLLIYSGGVATTVNCPLDSTVIALDVLKRRLYTGVATVTLFSPGDEPLCERMLFVQRYDQLDLAISSDKTTYRKRDRMTIKLDAKDRAGEPATGSFSVSVIDENKVPVDEDKENTILTELLLTSDMKGYIEQPGYYFNNISDKTTADLDLVMLTHGYRRFQWKQLLGNGYPSVAYQPEEALTITGTATNLTGKLLANGIISLVAIHGGNFARDTTDSKGHFHFDGLVFNDTAKFMLQAINAKGKNYTRLAYDGDKPGPVVTTAGINVDQSISVYMQNNKAQQEDMAKYGALKGRMLKNVTIRDSRKKEDVPISATRMVSPEFADQVIKPEQMAKGGPFAVRIAGALHGAHIVYSATSASAYAYLNGSKIPMRVILDGNTTDGDLNEILGDDVESVDVLKYGGSMGAYNGFSGGIDGILVINSKKMKGLQLDDIASIGILPITVKGFYKAREFYSPKYDHPAQTDARADLRSTIFWKPELLTDENGNASFDYYNADGSGYYRIVIEGIDDKGNIGRQIFRYKVE